MAPRLRAGHRAASRADTHSLLGRERLPALRLRFGLVTETQSRESGLHSGSSGSLSVMALAGLPAARSTYSRQSTASSQDTALFTAASTLADLATNRMALVAPLASRTSHGTHGEWTMTVAAATGVTSLLHGSWTVASSTK